MRALLIKYSVKGIANTFFFSCDENMEPRQIVEDIVRMLNIDCNMKERLFWEALEGVRPDIEWEGFANMIHDALVKLWSADAHSDYEAFFLRKNSSTLINF
jgi:hypothetical protein